MVWVLKTITKSQTKASIQIGEAAFMKGNLNQMSVHSGSSECLAERSGQMHHAQAVLKPVIFVDCRVAMIQEMITSRESGNWMP